jgi:peptidyl-prolyl isomerase D
VHHDTPEDLADEFLALRTPLLLNSALAALKAPGGPAGARIAINATNSTLALPMLSDADHGMYWLQTVRVGGHLPWLYCLPTPAAKALYRQGLALVALKEDGEAEKLILVALSLAKDDKAIAAELESIRQRKKVKRDKERAAYKKMFE